MQIKGIILLLILTIMISIVVCKFQYQERQMLNFTDAVLSFHNIDSVFEANNEITQQFISNFDVPASSMLTNHLDCFVKFKVLVQNNIFKKYSFVTDTLGKEYLNISYRCCESEVKMTFLFVKNSTDKYVLHAWDFNH